MSIKSTKVSATGTGVSGGHKILGLSFVKGASAGSIVIKDGGASGTTLIDLDTAAGSDSHYVPVPGGGIVFDTDSHLTLTNVTSVTVFYQD